MQLIIVIETRSSNQSDYKYIKSVIDYFYKPRSFTIKKIFASSKSELIRQDKKINKEIADYPDESKIIVFADTDKNDDALNSKIIGYTNKNKFDLVWMNSDVEEVFLGRKVNKRNKGKEADNYLVHYQKILPSLTNLENDNPLKFNKTSNILLVLNKYLEKK